MNWLCGEPVMRISVHIYELVERAYYETSDRLVVVENAYCQKLL